MSDKEPKTDPALKAVKPPAQDDMLNQAKDWIFNPPEKTQQLGPEPASQDYVHVSGFSRSLSHLVTHADKHAQVEGEYQSRWQDWKNKLESLWKEVNSHV
jgi:hypothetical protein